MTYKTIITLLLSLILAGCKSARILPPQAEPAPVSVPSERIMDKALAIQATDTGVVYIKRDLGLEGQGLCLITVYIDKNPVASLWHEETITLYPPVGPLSIGWKSEAPCEEVLLTSSDKVTEKTPLTFRIGGDGAKLFMIRANQP